jgi:hypothetical protein
MHFEAQKSFIKHSGYYFIQAIRYRDNPNFTKQHKSTPNMGWLLLWGTGGFSHLQQENNSGRPETVSFTYYYYKIKFFITFSGYNEQASVIS